MTKSMTDVAYDIMSKKKRAVQFTKLWTDVSKETGASKDAIADFYSDLTLDRRFTSLKNNKWDLTERRKFSESHVDLKKIEIEEDEDTQYDPEGVEEEQTPTDGGEY